jgi:hypothetical protein
VALHGTGVAAGNYASGESYTGVKLGLVNSGEVDIDGGRADFARDLTGGVFFDFPLGSRFHYGLSADYFAMKWRAENDRHQFDVSEYLIDLGVNLKLSLSGGNSPFIVRPGIGIGFGWVPELEGAGLGSSTYTTLKVSVEVAYFGGRGGLGLVADGGVWYAPSGGDNELDVRIGPLVFLRGGLMF